MVLSEADLRRRDSRKLKESFFSSVDDSQISSLVRAYQENSGVMPASCQWVGEGSDMEVWRVNGALMPLALRLWRQPILEKCSHEAKTKDWQGAMRRLDGAEGILVPPFWLISIREVIGVVTPHGDLDVSRLGRHWQPLEARIAEFNHYLRGLGLILNDSVQICTIDGIPFIHDFSDLENLAIQ